MDTPIVDYLSRQKELFENQFRRTYQVPTKKNIHDLRVTVRRIRAALWLTEKGSPHIPYGKLPTSLRELGHVLGKLRELDVAIQDATFYRLKTKKLKSQRRTEKQKLLSKIESKHYMKILCNLETAVKKLRQKPELDLKVGLLRLRERIIPWMRKKKINDNELHDLRIIVKKIRYVLESVERPIYPLRKLQTPLGRGHDLEILQELSGKSKKIQTDSSAYYQKARKIILPTLHFAIEQLERPSKYQK